MAQPGEFFPQQFALGVLNLFNSVKQKNAELQEMRRERAARNLIEQQRIDMSNIINQRNVALQEKQLESEVADREAEREFRYKQFEEARKASAQDAVTRFGSGQPAFFPLGVAIPQAPTVKDASGKEVPAFEYIDYQMPGLGTFVLPRNKLTDQLSLQKLKQDLSNDQIMQIRNLMQAQNDAARGELYLQQVRRMRDWKRDPAQINAARQYNNNMLSNLQAFGRIWNSWSPEQQEKYGSDPRKAFEDYVGAEQIQIWHDSQAYLRGAYEAGKAEPDPGKPVPGGPLEMFQELDAMKLMSGISRGAPIIAGPEPASTALYERVGPSVSGLSDKLPAGYVSVGRRLGSGDAELEEALASAGLSRDDVRGSEFVSETIVNESGNAVGRRILEQKRDAKGRVLKTNVIKSEDFTAPAAAPTAAPATAPGPLAPPAPAAGAAKPFNLGPSNPKNPAFDPNYFKPYEKLSDEENNFIKEMLEVLRSGGVLTEDERARVQELQRRASRP